MKVQKRDSSDAVCVHLSQMHLTQKKSREQLYVCAHFLVAMELTWKLNSNPCFFHFGKQVAQTVFWSGTVSLSLKPGVISTSKRGFLAGGREETEAPSWQALTVLPVGYRTAPPLPTVDSWLVCRATSPAASHLRSIYSKDEVPPGSQLPSYHAAATAA